MAILEDECKTVYKELKKLLIDYDLSWIVDEIEEKNPEDQLTIDRYPKSYYRDRSPILYSNNRLYKDWLYPDKEKSEIYSSYDNLYIDEEPWRKKLFLLIDTIENSFTDITYFRQEIIELLTNEVEEETLQEAVIHFLDETGEFIEFEIDAEESEDMIEKINEFKISLRDLARAILWYPIASEVSSIYRELKTEFESREYLWPYWQKSYEYNYLSYVADIFLIIINAARAEGTFRPVQYFNGSGKRAKLLTFRQSPGQIYTNNDSFTHAVLEFDRNFKLEVHVGIMTQGKSGVEHECDICIIPYDKAQSCRDKKYNQQTPQSKDIIMGCECKYYKSKLNLDLGRSFLGLDADFDVQENYYLISNTFSKKIAQLLIAHNKNFFYNIYPTFPNEVNKLLASFQRDFQRIKIKNSIF
ncbi:hypothetical protein PN462_16425 [Spirulina sp. CS-785/01]|uniref:hypothetical protein n=1 Tax=Spirulina sp. CS-785/01 TaxID=3021716 RepID=UPI00232AD89D|nr:hypothetical protein [Spirulina sp. CS-785/01]MDB9314700.1 hypothetical protein [Spirulina sp. CS-785/01]